MRLSLAIEGFLLFRAGAGSINTMRDYQNTLRKWLTLIGDVDTSELAADHVRRFLYHLRIEEKLSPKTVKNAWIGLSAFFTWLDCAVLIPARHPWRAARRWPGGRRLRCWGRPR